MADRVAKDALYEGFAEVARALASGRRAEIADLLAQGERPVEQIAVEIGQSVANTSHHLRAMARAGLVTTRRDGTRIYYALASDRVAGLWLALTQVAAEHVAGLERLAAAYLGSREGIEEVGRDELAARLARGEVLLLDVRPAAEYEAGHIAGAGGGVGGERLRYMVVRTCARCLPVPTSWPTAAVPTACMPTRRCVNWPATGSGHGGWPMGFPSGSGPGCPWRPGPPAEGDGGDPQWPQR
jgi:DNA-binding transcriptional ArsR family regulator